MVRQHHRSVKALSSKFTLQQDCCQHGADYSTNDCTLSIYALLAEIEDYVTRISTCNSLTVQNTQDIGVVNDKSCAFCLSCSCNCLKIEDVIVVCINNNRTSCCCNSLQIQCIHFIESIEWLNTMRISSPLS